MAALVNQDNLRCIYCLDDKMLFKNKLCPCNYYFHSDCQKKIVINSQLKCPLCRKIHSFCSNQTVQFLYIENTENFHRYNRVDVFTMWILTILVVFVFGGVAIIILIASYFLLKS